ncbi:MAG TPA: PQQ-dependent sugar dehydrogenase [Nitrososphaera sp.]|nr:PQQ-dependent sugar dehydrogenase [Nitrososphaera sp.]
MERKQTIIFFLMAAGLITGQSIAFIFWGITQNEKQAEGAYLSAGGNDNIVPVQLSISSNNNTFQVLPDPTPPSIPDPSIRVEKVLTGLELPTSMAFIDNDDIIITQKDNGRVRLVSNGVLQPQPILEVPVANNSERGLLGVAIANGTTTNSDTMNVFLYYTEPIGEQVRNRLYKYEWTGTGNLTGGQIILDLPGEPGPNHDGGKIAIGPDRMLYAVIGDLNRDGMLQNVRDGPVPDDTSVILRVDHNGNGVGNSLSAIGADMSKYYAYGVRNSFGFDFDPLTGILWDVEDGSTQFDEINIVLPGFNSGWNRVMGPIAREGITTEDLVQFQGSHYSDPVFSWLRSEGVTDMEIFNSSSLGERYTYNLFVGDINNGHLYFFTINSNRTGIDLTGIPGLEDLVADNNEELNAVIFGRGFTGGITDIETGPDGNLYILTLAGDLYRLVRNDQPSSLPTPSSVL